MNEHSNETSAELVSSEYRAGTIRQAVAIFPKGPFPLHHWVYQILKRVDSE